MANEIEKTIEELEAEVLSELEEQTAADAAKKGAAPVSYTHLTLPTILLV